MHVYNVNNPFIFNFDVSVFTRGYYARNSNHTRIREVSEQPAQYFPHTKRDMRLTAAAARGPVETTKPCQEVYVFLFNRKYSSMTMAVL